MTIPVFRVGRIPEVKIIENVRRRDDPAFAVTLVNPDDPARPIELGLTVPEAEALVAALAVSMTQKRIEATA